MVDVAELSSDVISYKLQGRHGMAMLARYRFGRKLSSVNEIDQEILEYFDTLAEALLSSDAAGLAIRDVVVKPELGLAHARRGRPKIDPSCQHYTDDHKKYKGYNAALHCAGLIESGMSRTDAESNTCDAFKYMDAKSIQNASRTFKIAVDREMKRQATLRRWEERNKEFMELYSLEPELRIACLAIGESTPQIKIALLSERLDMDTVVVTFPPSKPSLRKLLTMLGADDPVQEIGEICVAAETGESLAEVRRVFNAWPISDMLAFASAALEHLEQSAAGS